MLEAIPVFLVITALIAWLNARFIKLPSTIRVMAAALLLSTIAILFDHAGYGRPRDYAGELLGAIDFSEVLISAGLPVALLGTRSSLPKGACQILTWGGLRGGISVALALSLSAGGGT